jgi:transcription elongation factor Elf1
MTDKNAPTNEEIDCPFCGKARISVTTTPGYYSYSAARAFGKVKNIPVYHEEKVEVASDCPACGKTRKEIKEVVENGGKPPKTFEERLARMRESGLPVKFASSLKN